MSKATEIWGKGIGSVHGADVTNKLCYETASGLAAYARELEKEQSDLDWLEGEIKNLVSIDMQNTWWVRRHDVLGLIKKRREAKS
jgi:hypothetical protein